MSEPLQKLFRVQCEQPKKSIPLCCGPAVLIAGRFGWKITELYKRVIGLVVLQAQIRACALLEQADGSVRIERAEFGGCKHDRTRLAEWVCAHARERVVMESVGI